MIIIIYGQLDSEKERSEKKKKKTTQKKKQLLIVFFFLFVCLFVCVTKPRGTDLN